MTVVIPISVIIGDSNIEKTSFEFFIFEISKQKLLYEEVKRQPIHALQGNLDLLSVMSF